MKIFTIESETNNISVHATMKEAEAVAGAERFRNEAALAKLAGEWPASRLVEIWNSLPGVEPVKKFKDRKAAVARIWQGVQSLTPPTEPATATPEAPQTPHFAPEKGKSATKATRAKKAP